MKTLDTLQNTAQEAHKLARTIEMQVGILSENRDTPALRKARIDAVLKHAEEIGFLMTEIEKLTKALDN